MFIFYQKYYLQINLFMVALFGLACGLLGGALLDVNIPWDLGNEKNTPTQALEQRKAVTSADLDLILQRNLFDPSARSSAVAVSFRTGEDQALDGEDAATKNPAPGNRILLGTVVAGDESLALMQTDGKFTIYHLDEELPDGGTIVKISRNTIQIREPDQSLTDLEVPAEKSANTTSSARVSARGNSLNSLAKDAGIKQLDDNRWVVSQSTAEATRENLPVELRLAQLQPRMTNGQTDGFIIRRLKRTSILNKLGLKRGDVIQNVNGIPLNGPEAGLQVFQQLREARQIDLAVERKGEAMTFSYELN
jgi:general secretion pathway protein C